MFTYSSLWLALVGLSIAGPLDNPSQDQAFPILLDPAPSVSQSVDQPATKLEPPNSELKHSELELSNLELEQSELESSNLELKQSNFELEQSDLSKYFDSRIVGGSVAPESIAPHMTAMVVGWLLKFFTCGGSIIGKNYILTAAHCVQIYRPGHLVETYHAIVGTNTWNHGGVIAELESYRIHDEYDFTNIKNDIAVLKTKYKITFTASVAPICLDYKWVGDGIPVYVTGWGTNQLWGSIPEQLQILYMKTVSEAKCRQLVTDTIGQWGWSPPIEILLEICTFHSHGHGMCHGDSGSALVLQQHGFGNDHRECQAGIVSWGFPCAVGGPDIFVRVSAMKRFITDSVKHM